MPHVRVYHRAYLVQIDLLIAEVQRIPPGLELPRSHAKHTLIERDGFFNAGNGEYNVVERFQNNGHGVWRDGQTVG
ncbi:hypothetical protein D3C71_1499740 [compost metagenome]